MSQQDLKTIFWKITWENLHLINNFIHELCNANVSLMFEKTCVASIHQSGLCDTTFGVRLRNVGQIVKIGQIGLW